jgi:hypothetical protein
LNNAIAREKDAKKKMNATNAKALTAMKQKVRKAIRENEGDVKSFHEVSGLLCILLRSLIDAHVHRIPKVLNARTHWLQHQKW